MTLEVSAAPAARAEVVLPVAFKHLWDRFEVEWLQTQVDGSVDLALARLPQGWGVRQDSPRAHPDQRNFTILDATGAPKAEVRMQQSKPHAACVTSRPEETSLDEIRETDLRYHRLFVLAEVFARIEAQEAREAARAKK